MFGRCGRPARLDKKVTYAGLIYRPIALSDVGRRKPDIDEKNFTTIFLKGLF